MADNQASHNRDDPNVLQRKKRSIASDSHSEDRLACPFYRHCPAKYQKYRSCAGPGWSTIHRVKEHIRRQHAPPIHCVRCSTLFASETELHKHLTLPAPCPLRISTSPAVGFNKEQEQALRKKGRGPAEKQWIEMYKILFPLVPEELIPSSRYENSAEELEKRRRRDLDQMESYLRLELSRGVRRRLEKKSLELPRPLEDQVRRHVIEIIESAQADAFQSYRQQATRVMETPGPDANYQPFTSAQQSQITYGFGPEAAFEIPAFTTMAATTLDNMRQQDGVGSCMDSQTPDMSFINWDLEPRATEFVTL